MTTVPFNDWAYKQRYSLKTIDEDIASALVASIKYFPTTGEVH